MAEYEDKLFVRLREMPQELFDQIEAYVKTPDPPSGHMINIDNTYTPPSFLHINSYSRRKSATIYIPPTPSLSPTSKSAGSGSKLSRRNTSSRSRHFDSTPLGILLRNSCAWTPRKQNAPSKLRF